MIPKIIHYCWFGNGEKSKLMKKCIRSWSKYCKDWEIIEWNETNIDFDSMPLYVKQAYEAKKWGFVPDYIRLWLIYTYGGIYLDTDVEIIKPLDPLLELEAFAGLESPKYVALGLGFGAEKGNPVIKKLMNSYESLSFYNPDGGLNMVPAPQLNYPVFKELGLVEDGSYQVLDKLTVLPTDYLCPMEPFSRNLKKTKNTYSIHWYTASWWDEKKRKERKQRQVAIKRDKLVHIPNRILKSILGNERYDNLKKNIKRLKK